MYNSILIVDDEESIRRNLKSYFESRGFSVQVASDGGSAVDICSAAPVDLVILDLRLPDLGGLEVLEIIKTNSPGTGVIIITAYGDVETAVRAMKMKADNFVLKPVDLAALEAMINRTLENYRAREELVYLKQKVSRLEGSVDLETLRQPQEVYHAIKLLAENSSTSVLVLGETGTGKGMVTRAIHDLSERRDFPFVDINCAGLSAELLESELFGHEKGAFTDAKTQKKGLLEVADGGSMFLDEIGDLSPSVQAKLLKVLEEKSFRRLGGTVNIKVDVRIMASTHVDLQKAMREEKFRPDLYYRLNTIPIVLTPLRGRRDDIMPLARFFLNEFGRLFVKDISGFSPEVESMLTFYSWPGNIRELRNVIERSSLLCEGNTIQSMHLPDNIRHVPASGQTPSGDDLSIESAEKKQLEKALAACKQNRSQAAKMLGIHRSTLIKKIKKYSL